MLIASRISTAELFSYGMRRAFDYLGLWTQRSGARCVRIQSSEPDVIQQVLLRLPSSLLSVDLPAENLIAPERWPWAITVNAEAEAALYPFSLEAGMPLTPMQHVIGCFRNTYSYKKILHSATPSMTIRRVIHKLNAGGYRCDAENGIYPPTFIAVWLLAIIADRFAWPIYFPLKDYALRRINASRFERPFSYIVVFHGQR